MIVNNNLYTPSFTARCPQNRDGEWVCHIINERFPHFSISKFKPLFQKELKKHMESRLDTQRPWSMINIYYCASLINQANKGKKGKPFTKIIQKIEDIIIDFGEKRRLCEKAFRGNYNIFAILKFLSTHKLGNCHENAALAELVLKLNGVKNAKTMYIKNGNTIEHAVCVFNKDGSPFKEIVNNKTIIIDPWSQKADFANKMLIYLKNNFGQHLLFDDNINFEIHNNINLSPAEIRKLKDKYPFLIFKSKNHKFMQY